MMIPKQRLFAALVASSCLMALVVSQNLDGRIIPTTRELREQQEHYSMEIAGEALLDAIFAAGENSLDSQLGWNDILALSSCVNTTVSVKDDDNESTASSANASSTNQASPVGTALITATIPTLISHALRHAGRLVGRVVEYTNTEFSLGDNYKSSIKGATLACLVSGPLTSDDGIGPAAYASHIVGNNYYRHVQNFTDNELKVKPSNWTMVLEADVIELGGQSMLHVPKKYCLDLKDKVDFGANTVFEQIDAFAGYSPGLLALEEKTEIARPVSFGARTGTISSFRNHLYWQLYNADVANRTTKKPFDRADLIKAAYSNPKAELLAFVETLQSEICFDRALSWRACYELALNMTEMEYTRQGLSFDSFDSALLQYLELWNTVNDWEATFLTIRNESLAPLGSFNNTSLQNVDYAAPFVFHPSVAKPGKNSIGPSILANPFYSSTDLIQRIGVGSVVDNPENVCDSTNESSAAVESTLFLNAAIHRRLWEYPQGQRRSKKQSLLKDWAMVVPPLFRNFYQSMEASYLAQNVTWVEDDDEDTDLLERNLTEKIMGKTADWLIITNRQDGGHLQEMLDRALDDTNTYSRTLGEAVQLDNPCDQAVTNDEIYLSVFSMALAACGGVTAVLLSVHNALYLANHLLFGCRNTPSVLGWRRFLPTYELFLTFLGGFVFWLLYVPVYLQVQKENEVASYKTEAMDVEATYGQCDPVVCLSDKPMLVTMVHVETRCIDARPQLMKVLFVGGLILGLVINLPLLARTYSALVRYCRRVVNGIGENDVPKNCTVTDNALRLVQPQDFANGEEDQLSSVVDDADSSSLKSLVSVDSSCSGPIDAPKRDRTEPTQRPSSLLLTGSSSALLASLSSDDPNERREDDISISLGQAVDV